MGTTVKIVDGVVVRSDVRLEGTDDGSDEGIAVRRSVG